MKITIHAVLMFLPFLVNICLAGEIVKTYEFSAPGFQQLESYSLITFNGTRQAGEAGRASLPFFAVKLLLPAGEIAGAISIEFEEPLRLKDTFVLLPFQYPTRFSDTLKRPFLKDENFYSRDEFYPSEYNARVQTHFFRGHSIALSAFTPVRYNPYRQELLYYRKVTVRISTVPDPGQEWNRNLQNNPESLFLRLLGDTSA